MRVAHLVTITALATLSAGCSQEGPRSTPGVAAPPPPASRASFEYAFLETNYSFNGRSASFYWEWVSRDTFQSGGDRVTLGAFLGVQGPFGGKDDMAAYLSALGADGWELVQRDYQQEENRRVTIWTFKRRGP